MISLMFSDVVALTAKLRLFEYTGIFSSRSLKNLTFSTPIRNPKNITEKFLILEQKIYSTLFQFANPWEVDEESKKILDEIIHRGEAC